MKSIKSSETGELPIFCLLLLLSNACKPCLAFRSFALCFADDLVLCSFNGGAAGADSDELTLFTFFGCCMTVVVCR